MNCYIVICSCSHDDVILGVHENSDQGLEAAKQQMQDVIAHPLLRLDSPVQASGSEMVGAMVIEVIRGKPFQKVDAVWFDDVEMSDEQQQEAASR